MSCQLKVSFYNHNHTPILLLLVNPILYQIISAQYLPKPNTDNDIIDPYVVIEIHGLACDTKTFRTRTIKNNGIVHTELQ